MTRSDSCELIVKVLAKRLLESTGKKWVQGLKVSIQNVADSTSQAIQVLEKLLEQGNEV